MQPSDNLSVAVSKISEARFSPHILRKKVRPLEAQRFDQECLRSAVANPWSPPSTDSHAKGNYFPRNFRAVSVVVTGGFFRPWVISFPNPRECTLPAKEAF